MRQVLYHRSPTLESRCVRAKSLPEAKQTEVSSDLGVDYGGFCLQFECVPNWLDWGPMGVLVTRTVRCAMLHLQGLIRLPEPARCVRVGGLVGCRTKGVVQKAVLHVPMHDCYAHVVERNYCG